MLRKYYLSKVKTHRKYTLFFLVIVVGTCTQLSFIYPNKAPQVADYYLNSIKAAKQYIIQFQQLSKKKESLAGLKKCFIQCRLSYKKLAVLTEYFNPYETVLLNSPALDRLASDSPDDIAAPVGYQAVEQLLYSNWNTTTGYKKLEAYLKGMQAVFTRLENEPDKDYRFQPKLLWDALRSATLRLISLGITGFDSPLAKLSLPEARASIEGIKNLLPYLKSDETDLKEYNLLFSQIAGALQYLKIHTDFDAFDRLTFITKYADPLYKQINKVRGLSNAGVPDGANPINFSSTSIFDANAFDINFFSPSKEYWVTKERIELGKKLFYDNILSGTKERNCASCHKPEMAFTDGLKTPFSIDNKTPLLRNSPTLLNSVFQTKLFYDSRVSLLEGQLNAVIHNTNEMKGSLEESVKDLKKNTLYAGMFNNAYRDEINPLTPFTITNAISCYIRSLTSLNSRFDLFMRGDSKKLSDAEKKGFNLFAGKGKCATCHYIPLFNGLVPPVFNETESEVIGVPSNTSKTKAKLDNDLGKYGFTTSPIHKYAFKTPTLRNIALTAPYMHNGVYKTLEEVVEFYNNGGGKGLKIAPSNQTLPFDKLGLTVAEKKNLVAFLKTLTDTLKVY